MSAQRGANPTEIENAVRVVFIQTTQAMFIVMKKYDNQCHSVTLLCVFDSFWMTIELCGTKE